MPIVNHMGFSDETPLKQEAFTVITNTWFKAAPHILKRASTWAYPTFFYFDLNAGCGSYPEYSDASLLLEPLPGSPLIAIEAAIQGKLNFEAALCEVDKENWSTLLDNLTKRFPEHSLVGMPADDTTAPMLELPGHEILIHIIHAKFEHMQDHFLSRLREATGNRPSLCQPFGMIYSDGNGTIPPLDFLGETAKEFPRIDLLMHVAATPYKRALYSPKHPVDKTLAQAIANISKKYWLVREPYGNHQWTFLLGTNWPGHPLFTKQKFWLINSPQGIEILRRISLNRFFQQPGE